LAAREAEDWIWSGSSTLPRIHDRTILRLSRGGGDAVVLREFDIATKAFVAGGFHLPGMATASGYARTVRLWQRWVDVARAPVLFETTPDSMSAWASVDRTQGTERVWFVERPAFFEMITWLGDRAGPTAKLGLPSIYQWRRITTGSW
jgi:prolyl oligopeptidase